MTLTYAQLMDAQTCLNLTANPCLSVLELQQQLPCSEDLWDAPTAETWKDMFLKCTSKSLRRRSRFLPNIQTATAVPTVPQTMEILRQGDSLSPTIGDFARLVLVFVTYAEV